MALEKRVKRVFLKNKSKYLGSLFLVALGCTLYIVLNTLVVNLNGNLESLTKKSIREDAKAVLVKDIDNLDELEKRFDAVIEKRKSFDYEIKNGVSLRVFDFSEKVDIPFIVKGSTIKRDNDILINPAFADTQGINIGDKIKMLDEEFYVSGYMTIPDYVYPTKLESDIVADPNSFGIAVISKNKMSEMNNSNETINIRYNSALSYDIKEYLNKNFGIMFWQNIDDNPRYTMVKGEVTSLRQVTLSIPMVIFLLTCLLLSTVIWRMVKMEFVEIGTLYAIGYTKKEILRHYLTYPLAVAISGAAIGEVLSLLLVKPILRYYSFYFNLPIMKVNYRLEHMVIGFVMPVVLLTAAGIVVTLRALRLSPVKLMRGHGQKSKVGILEKNINLRRHKFKTKFKIREILRSFSKIIIIILGVTASSMLLLLGSAAQDSFDYLVKDGMNNSFKYNYNYVFKAPMKANTYKGEEYNAAPFTTLDKKEEIVVYGIRKDSTMINLEDKGGKRIDGGKTVISRSFAKKMNLKIGNVIEIQNKLNDKKYSIKVDDICEVYIGSFIYMPIEEFNKIMGVDEKTYTGIFSDRSIDIDKNILLKTESREETIKAFDSFIKPMRYFLLGAGVLAFIIALIILYIMISLIIEENKVSISMLKVLGYGNREIGSMLMNTFNIPVIIGYIISIPLLYMSLGRVMDSSMKEIDMTTPIIIAPIKIAIGFVIMYLTYEFSKFLSKRKVLSISMAESLKAQRE